MPGSADPDVGVVGVVGVVGGVGVGVFVPVGAGVLDAPVTPLHPVI